ncbi:MAG: cytochrome c [Cytophagaceae bacterium]|nr:cytochrome c [Cytophagaceae bacterium]
MILVAWGGWACSNPEAIKHEQFVIAGAELYAKHCSNCHGVEGQGLGKLYPPIKGSDFLKNKNKVICIIKNGSSVPVTVNGIIYDGKMLKNKNLYDLDIAQITTFIYDRWGEDQSTVETEQVTNVKCE